TDIDLASGRKPESLQHGDERGKPDGEGRQQDVPGNDPGKLESREKYRVEFHRLASCGSLGNVRQAYSAITLNGSIVVFPRVCAFAVVARPFDRDGDARGRARGVREQISILPGFARSAPD